MKSYNNLWDSFISKENFEIACHNSQLGKKWQKQVKEFNKDYEGNLEKVRQLVISGQFHTSNYKTKKIYEPKERTIYKLPYCPDRIVQHAAMNVLKPILLSKFMLNSFACIEGRGQLKAGNKCAEFVRKYDYCLKCDISKFYPSINQHILSEMLHKVVKDKRFMTIVDDIIFSYEGGYNCPIGNYCSQWFGNFYLTRLDNYVLHTLKCGAYERYCDDFMLFSNDKRYLKDCKEKIEIFLNKELELHFSKAEVFNVKQGVDFCGYRYFKKYPLLRKSTAKRLKRRFKAIDRQLASGEFDIERIAGQLASANGLLKHGKCYNLRKSIGYYEKVEVINGLRKANNNRAD